MPGPRDAAAGTSGRGEGGLGYRWGERVWGWLGLVSWGLAIIGIPIYFYRKKSEIDSGPSAFSILEIGIENWIPLTLFALVLLMIVGRLGVSLGIPGLFRDAPPPSRGSVATGQDRGLLPALFGSGAFWGSFGATVLMLQVWIAIYYLDLIHHPEHWIPVGNLRDHPEELKKELLSFVGMLRDHSGLLDFLWWTAPPCLILLALAALFPARAPGIERRKGAFFVEMFRYALGMLAAIGLVRFFILLGSFFHRSLSGRWLQDLYHPMRRFLRVDEAYQVEQTSGATLPAAAELMTSLGLFVLMGLAYLLIFGELARDWSRPRHGAREETGGGEGERSPWPEVLLSPGQAICILLGMVLLAFSVLMAMVPVGRAIALSLFVLAMVLANLGAYKYRYPGMDSYRGRGNRVPLKGLKPGQGTGEVSQLEDRAVLEAWWWGLSEGKLAPEDNAALAPLMDRLRATSTSEERRPILEELDAIKERRPQIAGANPRLVLVAVTGAAYRSAFWTATVLDHLCEARDDLPGFARHVRLLTGASGGMVGAAYFAVMMEGPGGPTSKVVDRLRAETRLDSLTPVVRRLLRRDLTWGGFLPLAQDYDRGVELERQWKTLAVTFPELAAEEAAGLRPSLIVSPMVVESGRRILFSNLDLAGLTTTTSVVPRGASKAQEPHETRPTTEGGSGPRLYSQPASEFARVFPKAWRDFKLQTAVRMNATFPYISPAVSLPTEPPRRVVDAGYYDNYGVDLIASWAYVNQDWIARNTSGVGLLQVRAYPSEDHRKDYFDPIRDAPAGLPSRIVGVLRRSIQWLTSPVEAAVSARGWSMSFRNDEEIRALDDHFNGNGRTAGREGPARFFETFVLENPLDFAMNWFLSEQDLADMKRSLASPNPDLSVDRNNRDQLRLLFDWWKG